MTPPLPPLALLSSPLLGPAVWGPVSQVLAGLGWDVHLVPGPATAPNSGDEMLTHLIAHLPAAPDLAVAAHSNAGLYLPALTRVRQIVSSVYVDAALPAADGPIPLAPPRLASFVADLAAPDGLLPPWSRWWDEADVAPLFPDPATRAEVERQQHRLPLDYFTSTIDTPTGWTDQPAAYLSFGEGYQAERSPGGQLGLPCPDHEPRPAPARPDRPTRRRHPHRRTPPPPPRQQPDCRTTSGRPSSAPRSPSR